jgi:hypothetical protein
MSTDDAKLLTAIQVSMGRVEMAIDNLSHRFRNMEQANLGFVPRREIEQANENLSERLEKLENRHEWFNRWLWGAWVAGVLSVAGFGRKTGLF